MEDGNRNGQKNKFQKGTSILLNQFAALPKTINSRKKPASCFWMRF